LWPPASGSVEEAGYEFANALTEDYRREWWNILLERIGAQNNSITGDEARRANAAENALRDILPVFDNESMRTLARVYAKEIATAEALLKANAAHDEESFNVGVV
jgi:hypothetical protein